MADQRLLGRKVPRVTVWALHSFVATGRLLWKLQTGGPVHSAPAIDGGRVYVGA